MAKATQPTPKPGTIHIVGTMDISGTQSCLRCGITLPKRDIPFDPQAVIERDGVWTIFVGQSDAVPCESRTT